LKIAAIQFNAVDDEAANIARILDLVRRAAADGAKLIALPEVAWFRGRGCDVVPDTIPGRATAVLEPLARELGVWIHGGSLAEAGGENASANEARFFNTSFVVAPDGSIAGVYRKIHLFDVEMPEMRIMESDTYRPGSELVTANAGPFTLGMVVCYDLRFPGLWQKLRTAGADLFVCPANFTRPTGEAHWEVLLRARAIETQSYVVAPGQWGPHPHRDFEAYGRTLIIDPWGKILAEAGAEGDAIVTADADPTVVAKVRGHMPVWSHRRKGVSD
jgi:predicted amidohydrolase